MEIAGTVVVMYFSSDVAHVIVKVLGEYNPDIANNSIEKPHVAAVNDFVDNLQKGENNTHAMSLMTT